MTSSFKYMKADRDLICSGEYDFYARFSFRSSKVSDWAENERSRCGLVMVDNIDLSCLIPNTSAVLVLLVEIAACKK